MRAAAITALAGALALGACTDGASADPGLAARLHVDGAQFRPGAFPAATGGPETVDVSTRHSHVLLGRLDEPLRALVAPEARAVAIGLAGSDGAWLVTAGPPDLETPDFATARAVIGLADDAPVGELTLLVAAADAAGRFGPPASRTLIADAVPPPTGELVIGLTWDGPADLDLHVVDALGGEAWSDKPNTMVAPPPGTPVDPTEYLKHGILDHDGNKDCHLDGAPSEHVVWQQVPPSGSYVVRVDARAMCGAPSVTWTVAADRQGTLLGSARGLATADDTLLPHGAGAGVRALGFTLP